MISHDKQMELLIRLNEFLLRLENKETPQVSHQTHKNSPK